MSLYPVPESGPTAIFSKGRLALEWRSIGTGGLGGGLEIES